jgi:hypothetical protein
MRHLMVALLLSVVASSSLAIAPARHGLLVQVLMRSYSEDQFKRVGTLSDGRRSFTFSWSAPHEASVTVFRMEVAPTGRCEAQISLTPLDAVRNLTPSLPTTITPGAMIEFETLRGWDDRTYFRLLVIPGKYCKRTASTT